MGWLLFYVAIKIKTSRWICFLQTLSFWLLKMLTDGLEWCGLLWCFYQLFGLSFWRHPFTAEHPLLRKWCNATFRQIWWKIKLYILDDLRVNKLSANVIFSFHPLNLISWSWDTWTCRSKKHPVHKLIWLKSLNECMSLCTAVCTIQMFLFPERLAENRAPVEKLWKPNLFVRVAENSRHGCLYSERI